MKRIVLISLLMFSRLLTFNVNAQDIVFNRTAATENPADTINYVLKKDGTKIFGKKILAEQSTIIIDNQVFMNSEIKGYMEDLCYNERMDGKYYLRLVRGDKFNIYGLNSTISKTTYTATQNGGVSESFKQFIHGTYFVEYDNSGNLVWISSDDEIRKLVKDCPKSLINLDKKPREIRKILLEDPTYFTKVMEKHNNGCK